MNESDYIIEMHNAISEIVRDGMKENNLSDKELCSISGVSTSIIYKIKNPKEGKSYQVTSLLRVLHALNMI